MGRFVLARLLFGLLVFSIVDSAAQTQAAQPGPPPAGTIHGIVKSGNMPIPGAAVSVTLASSNQNPKEGESGGEITVSNPL